MTHQDVELALRPCGLHLRLEVSQHVEHIVVEAGFDEPEVAPVQCAEKTRSTTVGF